MKIGILGGTFNPPHNGHLWAAREARRQLGLDRIVLMPTGQPPHKKIPVGSATTQQRLEMTRLAAKELKAEVSQREIRRQGASYTALTLAELAREYPEDTLYFSMGTDMLLSFDTWYHPEEIVRLCRLVVIARHKNEQKIIAEKADQLHQQFGAQVCIVSCPPVDVSSTQVRQNLSRNVPLSVYQYIQSHHLYQTDTEEREEAPCDMTKKPDRTS